MANSFDTITKRGAIDYLSSYIEELEGDIKANHPSKMLYEERVLFFSKALELLKNTPEISQVKSARKKVKNKDGSVEAFILKAGGKSYNCSCGGNVFTKYDDIRDGWGTYICNSCKLEIEMM